MISTIERAEQLKAELTDKYVVVSAEIPELRRFAELTGTVKTVNMNCRALVQFDSAEDISWYDIDPSYLTVVDAPKEKKKAPAKAAPAKAAPKAGGAKKTSGGKSPLEMARSQGGGAAAPAEGKKLSPLEQARQQGGGAAPAKPAASDGGKKLSPLEQARQQGGGAAPAKPAASDGGKKLSPLEQARAQGGGAAAPAPKKAAPSGGKKLSPLEQARQQGGGAAPVSAKEEAPTPDPEPVAEAPKSAAVSDEDKGLSKIELARKQGAFKE